MLGRLFVRSLIRPSVCLRRRQTMAIGKQQEIFLTSPVGLGGGGGEDSKQAKQPAPAGEL